MKFGIFEFRASGRVEAEKGRVEELGEVARKGLRLLEAALQVLRERSRVRDIMVPQRRKTPSFPKTSFQNVHELATEGSSLTNLSTKYELNPS